MPTKAELQRELDALRSQAGKPSKAARPTRDVAKLFKRWVHYPGNTLATATAATAEYGEFGPLGRDGKYRRYPVDCAAYMVAELKKAGRMV